MGMMDFSGSAGAATTFDTIPKSAVLFAVFTVRGLKNSAKGGAYIDAELVVDAGQPFAGRKLWDMIGDPQNAGNSEGYRQMGTIAITRILEAGRGAGPNNMAGYQIDNYEQLSGLRVAIKTGIEEGTNGHPDKSTVAEYLTPNPASQSGHKGWLKLVAGDHLPAASGAAAQTATGFGGFGGQPAAAAQPATGGFGAAAQGGAGAAATSGFGQAQGANPADAATGQPQTTGFASTSGATAQSPSDPAATPGWLAQAAQ